VVVQSVLSRLGQLLKAQPKHCVERDGPMSDHELGRAIREIRLVISGRDALRADAKQASAQND